MHACERATDANGERIHPSSGPAITGKIANNGLRPFHGHHRNVGYAAKRAKICIHKKGGGELSGGAFIRMTSFNWSPEWTTKFGVIARHRHNEASTSY